MKNYNNFKSQLLIVSGGGSGGAKYYVDIPGSVGGGAISGYVNYNIWGDNNVIKSENYGADQERGGPLTNLDLQVSGANVKAGNFGVGADGSCGAGGGYYGGACYGAGSVNYSGGGGSGYIGGVIDGIMYCHDCQEYNNNSNPTWRTISTIGDDDSLDLTNCPDGYSVNPISKCAKAGNGYARVTYIKQ